MVLYAVIFNFQLLPSLSFCSALTFLLLSHSSTLTEGLAPSQHQSFSILLVLLQ